MEPEVTSRFFNEDEPVKIRLQSLARMNGTMAKLKANRLANILKCPELHKPESTDRRTEATNLAKIVSYHLRQAAIIGRHIDHIERTNRGN